MYIRNLSEAKYVVKKFRYPPEMLAPVFACARSYVFKAVAHAGNAMKYHVWLKSNACNFISICNKY